MPSLVATTGQSVDLPFKQVTVGSDPQCDIPMRADLGIAFRHLILNVTPQGTWMELPHPSPPLLVNGVSPVSSGLNDGDVLTLGAVTLIYRFQSPATVPDLNDVVAGHDRAVAWAASPIAASPLPKPQVSVTRENLPTKAEKNKSDALGGGCVMILLSIAILVAILSGFRGPLKETELTFVNATLAKAQPYQENNRFAFTLLTTEEGQAFKLPQDTPLDLSRLRSPIKLRLGVAAKGYPPASIIPDGEQHPVDIVTFEVNDVLLRTLAWHNKENAGATNVVFNIALGVGVLGVGFLLFGCWPPWPKGK